MRAKAAVLTGLVVLLGATATAVAASGASGNQHAIAIARAEVKAYGHTPVETYKETGYIEMTDQEGKVSYFRFNWGVSKPNPGWVWATERGTVALKNDRVVWWRDDLTPPACHRAGICHQIPVEIVFEKSGAYFAFGNAAKHTCFGRLSGNLPVTVGAQWARVSGHYLSPAYGPGVVKLTSTFPWGKGKATEIDTLSASSHLVRSSRIVIPGGHTIRITAKNPSRTPKAPKVTLCAG